MSAEPEQSPQIDLDRTDRLPILQGVTFDHDFFDDEDELLDVSAMSGAPTVAATLVAGSPAQDFGRPGYDLPSLAESVRSVEERIARQTAEYDALTRAHELSRAAENAASARVVALERDLLSARTTLESEHKQLRESEEALAERSAWVDAARSQVEEVTRERERLHTEGQALRESLASRDASIVQVLHSLRERDSQLATLQQEHVKLASLLESRSQTSGQLETDLIAARAALVERTNELLLHRDKVAALAGQLKRSDAELGTLRSDLAETRTQSTAFLELLRSREWRHGFDQNQYRELDARVGMADTGYSDMKAHRDQLQSRAANLDLQVAAQQSTIDKLQDTLARAEANLEHMAAELADTQKAREAAEGLLNGAEEQTARLRTELAWTENELGEARATAGEEAKRTAEVIVSAQKARSEHAALLEQREADHSAQLSQLAAQHKGTVERQRAELDSALAEIRADRGTQLARLSEQHAATVGALTAEAEARDKELAVLLAHLQEARRPIEVVEAQVQRLQDELIAKQAAFDQLTEAHREQGTTLERTRGALAEREFLIRRLERSESSNANVLGRIATSMERLGAGVAPLQQAAGLPPPSTEASGELVRLDGDRQTSHALGRRTRIGRGAGCELQIDSSSVSRHHAVVLASPREAIIEDLNSTNGVIVNGRKVSRQLLRDGDVILIGEVKFRYSLNVGSRPLEASSANMGPVSADGAT